jgi:TMEM175 potassium channel family protein
VRVRPSLGQHWSTSRTEAFSDGVFGFAITLLVADIAVPRSEFVNLWRGIAQQWPAYLGFATSFITVGGIWLVHHALFRRLGYANVNVMRINLLLLMVVAFLPFPTGLMAEALGNDDAERPAVLFYGACLLVVLLVLAALWGAVARDRTLLKPEVTAEEVATIGRLLAPNVGFYVAAGVVALVAPTLAAIGYLAIAIVLVLRAHGD